MVVEPVNFPGGLIQGALSTSLIRKDGDLYLVVLNGYDKAFYKNEQIPQFIEHYREHGSD